MELLTDKLNVCWNTAPEELDSKKQTKELFSSLDSLLSSEDHLKLFIEAPNLLSACINYNVLHKLDKTPIPQQDYTEFVKSAFKNDPIKAKAELLQLRNKAPDDFLDLQMESKKDKTTWRSTNPWLLRELSAIIKKDYDPELIISPAHGSIRPAILLSIMLNINPYFIRFSRFKQVDTDPKAGPRDIEFLNQVNDKRVLCYDEDTASGRTLEKFSAYLRKYAKNLKTATTINFQLSIHTPDYFAESFH